MKRTIKIGMMGFGQRGTQLMKDVILYAEQLEIAAVCDEYEDRTKEAAKLVTDAGRPAPVQTQNYEEMLAMDELDAIVITAAWESHIPCAIKAMRAGKYVGMEVGGAYSVKECWELVEAYEETGVPCMLLENCCYGREEMGLLNMKSLGMFGEIIHCKGGYQHDLRSEIARGGENRHYRLRNYMSRNCENYPTHELGPIAQLLDINRGNRMISLCSVASRAAGLKEYLRTRPDTDPSLQNAFFAQGDVVTTVITCAGGQTITLSLDTTLPRPYSRGLEVHGTKGAYFEDNHSFFFDGVHDAEEFTWKKQWDNAEKYLEEFEHPVWNKYKVEGVHNGHGGMDWLVFSAFFDAVRDRTAVPIDVYDAAAWMCISALSEQSVSMGGVPVAIPDFTRGRWIRRN